MLTGAGISAESGLKTFRDHDGLWENHAIEDVATPDAFAADPALVYRFYNLRRQALTEVKPNTAHIALAELEQSHHEVLLITQNVDDLHQRAGSQNLITMHGELKLARCTDCETVSPSPAILDHGSTCPVCEKTGYLRPHIVWFGEMPLAMTTIYQAVEHCDLFAAIGTSGHVYPAAGLVQIARQNNAETIELNREPSANTNQFDHGIYGDASKIVPDWVSQLTQSG